LSYLEEDLYQWMSEINKLKSTLNSIESNDILKDVHTTISDTFSSSLFIFFVVIFVFVIVSLVGS
jgi:hypothetical protein